MLHDGQHIRMESRKKRRLPVKPLALCAALMLIAGSAIGGTAAWLKYWTEPVENMFSIGQVSCEVMQEQVTGTLANVAVKNTSNDDAYIRVRLIGYLMDTDGCIIGGTGLPEGLANMSAPEGWLKIGEDYFCVTPIAAGESTPVLITNQAVETNQTVQVLAEAIQGKPAAAVTEAWGVTIDENGSITGKGA